MNNLKNTTLITVAAPAVPFVAMLQGVSFPGIVRCFTFLSR